MDPILQEALLGPPVITDLSQVPSLEAWYSTKDPADITTATGVQLWRDRSGKSNETLLACDRVTAASATNIAAFSTTDFSVAAWVNTESFAAAQYIIGGAANAFALYIHTDGKLTAKKQGAAALTAATTALTAGTLAHVAYVRSGVNSNYYINGAVAGTATDAANDYATACTLIGSTTNATTTPFGGTLQKLAIYNRALSAAEVAALYAAGGVPVAGDYASGTNDSGAIVYAGQQLVNGANSTFASDTGWWSKNAAVSITGGVLRLTSLTNNSAAAYKPSVLVANTKYRVTYTISNYSAGAVYVSLGNGAGTTRNANGTYTEDIVSSNDINHTLYIGAAVGTTTLDIDDITVTPVGLLAYWDFSTATRGAGHVIDTSGNNCDLTTSTGARISGARDLYQGTAASQPKFLTKGQQTLTGNNSTLATGAGDWANWGGTFTYVSAGVANLAASAVTDNGDYLCGQCPQTALALTSGVYYKLTITLSNVTNGTVMVRNLTASGQRYVTGLTNGTTVAYFTDGFNAQRNLGLAASSATATFTLNSIVLEVADENLVLADGSNDYLKTAPFPLVQPEWVVLVGRTVTYSVGAQPLGGFSLTQGMELDMRSATPNFGMYAGTSVFDMVTTAQNGVNGILTLVYNGANSTGRNNRNAPVTGDVGTQGAGGVTVGAARNNAAPANYLFNELAIFSRAPSAAEIDRVVRYMARKWSIAT